MKILKNIILKGLLILWAMMLHALPAIKAQSESLFQVSLNGRCGYIDSKGKLLFTLPAQVYQTGKFSEGLATVYFTTTDGYGRVGYIDVTGKTVIQPQFIRAEYFSEGLAPVEVNGLIGYINKQGKLIIEPKFHLGSPYDIGFSEGLAIARVSVRAESGPTALTGYINKQGDFVIQPKFIYAGPFKEGMARVSDTRGVTKYGYIDKSGKVIVPSQFPQALDFSEGLALVIVETDKESQTRKAGYIDKSGNFVIKPQFDDFYSLIGVYEAFVYDITGTEGMFSEGLASVRINGKWGYINRTGQIVVPTQFAHAGMFKEGLAPVAIKNGRRRIYGFIDHTGRFSIQPQYDLASEFNNGLAAVSAMNSRGEFDKHGYIDKSGKYIWKPTR